MSRPLKSGVDYFPKDVDFYEDKKVKLLKKEFGAKGMYVLDYILCKVYKENGYYLDWDEDVCLLVSDGADGECTSNFITEVINGCIRRSIFDKRVFDMFKVITSAGVQRRFLRMCNNREQIIMIKEYWLLDMDDKNDVPTGTLDKLTLKSVKAKQNSDKSKQNAIKSNENSEKKKETKIEETTSNTPPKIPEPICKEWNSYVEMRKKIRKPMTFDAMRLALKKLNELAPNDIEKQKAILNQSVFRSWQGLFPIKNDSQTNSKGPNNHFQGRNNNYDDSMFADVGKLEV